MKNFWLIVLMVVFPLQAALAAVEAYHGHGLEHESVMKSTLHTHADHHHDSQPESHQELQYGSDHEIGSVCEGDHHHCHAHSLTVLSNFTSFDFLPGSLSQIPERYKGYQSYFSNRIERPKWS